MGNTHSVVEASTHSPALHGRARERAAVAALLARAGTGRGGSLLLHGERGVGKTALLAYASAAASGCTVLHTAGLADEAHLRYAALHRLLEPILDQVGSLPTSRARAVAVALGSEAAGGGEVAGGDRGVFTAVRELLVAAAQVRPVVACVDDADQLDRPSLDAVAFAARRLAGQPVAMFVTARGPQVLTGVPAWHLRALSDPDSRTLLAELAPGPLCDPTAAALIRLAGGNPQALADLAGSLTLAQCTGAVPPPASLPAGSPLRRAYQDQLRRLPPETRWLLLLAAADPGIDVDHLVLAAQRSGMDITALAAAERDGLVQVTGEAVQFPQPLVGTIVYEAAPLAQRREAQLRLAEAATDAGDYRRAAAAMTRAAELTCRPVVAARRLVAAAGYAWQAGSLAEPQRLLRRIPGPALSEVEGERRLLAGEIELRTGAATTGLSTLLAAADTLAGDRHDLAIRALTRAVEAAWLAGDPSRYAEIAARAESLRRPGQPADQEQMLAYIAGLTATFLGRLGPAYRSLHRAVALAEPVATVFGMVLAAAASLLLADYPGARRLAAGAVDAAREAGYASALPLALELQAGAEYGQGRYDAVEAICQAGLRSARASGQEAYAANHLAMLAVLAAIRGEPATCRHRLQELVLPAGAGPLSRPAGLSQWAQAILDLTDARPAEAAARLGEIGDPATGRGQVVVQVMATPWLVEAAAHPEAGADRCRAETVLRLFHLWAESTGGDLLRALAARCYALLAPRGSTAALERFEEALRLHRPGECDFERARTELLYGGELRRHRQPRQARTHLHRALETFQHLSLPGWADRAAGELRAAGDQPPAGGRTGSGRRGAPPENLTAQQQEVARLVAQGATNREIAARLFLSPRTVDHHLRNIFHRLGIRSRVELARLLS